MQYGKDYEYDAPVKLLDKLLHTMAHSHDEQLVVISQVSFSLDPFIYFWMWMPALVFASIKNVVFV